LHSQDDIPEVSTNGFAIEPGKHAFAVVGHTVVSESSSCRDLMLIIATAIHCMALVKAHKQCS